MKNSLRFIIYVSLLAGIFAACSKSIDNTEKEEFEKEKIEQQDTLSLIKVDTDYYSLDGTGLRWIKVPWTDSHKDHLIIINNTDTLKMYIQGVGELPAIDFSKHTILFIRGVATYNVGQVIATLFQNESNGYNLDVIVHIGDATVMESWAIAIVVPQISNDTSIDLFTKQIRPGYYKRKAAL